MVRTQISVVSIFLLLVAAVCAQDYFNENYDSISNVRVERDIGTYILTRNDPDLQEHLRFRRDDDAGRHRRQGGHGGGHEGVTGPVHTFVKTDEHAHFKWGVRHHVGHEYAGRR